MLSPQISCRRNIYFVLVYSSLVYGIETYCNTTLTILKPLIIKCNSLLRVLQDKPRRYKTIDLHTNYNTLPVNQLYNLFAAKLMHKFYFDKNNLPNAISEMFVVNCDIHNYYNTRSKHNPHIRSNYYSPKSFSFIGPVLWSKLSISIRECRYVKSFVKMCKSYFLSWEQ